MKLLKYHIKFNEISDLKILIVEKLTFTILILILKHFSSISENRINI